MSLKPLSPQAAREQLARGAVLVDIRSSDEYAREHITEAICLPLDETGVLRDRLGGADTVIFHCRSGMRTASNAARLAESAGCDAYLLEGGLDAWKKAGLPVRADASQPLELQRQVHIAAGSMIVLGNVLGFAVAPEFHLLSVFVGGGLVFAGLSGFCGLARVLAKMPWNRRMSTG